MTLTSSVAQSPFGRLDSTDGEFAGLLSRAARGLRSSTIRELLKLTQQPHILSLAGGLPAAETFPVARLAAVAAQQMGAAALQYSPTEGYGPLREWIAADEARGIGRPVAVEEVIVTTGSQQALDLLSRVLLDPGDVVAIDDPGYLGALQAFEACGAGFLPIPVNAEGMDVAALGAALAGGARIKVCYTVPEGQNPTGATLSAARRQQLAALADAYGFVIIEDSPYRSMVYDGPAPAPIRAHTDRAVRLGTFSKTVAPGLRVGWAAGLPGLVATMTRAKQAADLHTPTLGQVLISELVTDDAWWSAHLGDVLACYGQRRDALVTALVQTLGAGAEFVVPAGGMFVWVRLPGTVPAAELLEPALQHGVAFVPGPAFAADPGDIGAHTFFARLSFATLGAHDLGQAVDRLGATLAGAGLQ